jgi:hypothetical protein
MAGKWGKSKHKRMSGKCPEMRGKLILEFPRKSRDNLVPRN